MKTESPLRIAVLGSKGRLGGALVRKWRGAHQVTGFARPECDLLVPETIDACLVEDAFDVVINCAATTNVDACELDPDQAMQANAAAPAHIARRCNTIGARLIHISTDYVFDGEKRTAYVETDPASPISVYGSSKAAGERRVLREQPEAIIARVSWVFGPEKPSFIDAVVDKARGNLAAAAVADKWSNPTYTEDLADWLMALISSDAAGGIYHLCNQGGCTWRDYGEYALNCAASAGLPLQTTTVAPLGLADMTTFVARRPVFTILDPGKFTAATGIHPAGWEDAVRRYMDEFVARTLGA